MRQTYRGDEDRIRAMSTKREFESPVQPELPKGPRALRIVIADDERDTVLTLLEPLRSPGAHRRP